jgi:hypothetical protein
MAGYGKLESVHCVQVYLARLLRWIEKGGRLERGERLAWVGIGRKERCAGELVPGFRVSSSTTVDEGRSAAAERTESAESAWELK